MQYVREFFTHRLIVFLMCVIAAGMTAFSFSSGGHYIWLMLLLGIVLFGTFEYITHRYLLHEFPKIFPKAYEGHVAHHQRPNDPEYLFGPITYDFISYIVYFLIFLAITRNIHMASAVVIGTSLCQLYYQWKHFISHRPINPVTPWGKWMKKQHLLHHHLSEENWYGVSHPFMDMLLGTLPDKNKFKKSADAASVPESDAGSAQM